MHVFVVRIWESAEPLPAVDEAVLRGVVERVGSGEQAAFVGGDQLLSFISRRPPAAGEEGPAPPADGGA